MILVEIIVIGLHLARRRWLLHRAIAHGAKARRAWARYQRASRVADRALDATERAYGLKAGPGWRVPNVAARSA